MCVGGLYVRVCGFLGGCGCGVGVFGGGCVFGRGVWGAGVCLGVWRDGGVGGCVECAFCLCF